jgi:hypothetical protein
VSSLLAICHGMGWSWPDLLATPPDVIAEAAEFLRRLAEAQHR